MLYPVLMKVGSDEADIPGGQPVNIHGSHETRRGAEQRGNIQSDY